MAIPPRRGQRFWPIRRRQLRENGTSPSSCAYRFVGTAAERIPTDMLAATLTKIAGVARVIALKFPLTWFPTTTGRLLLPSSGSSRPVGPRRAARYCCSSGRELVFEPTTLLSAVRLLFTNSSVTASRLRRF